MTLSRDKSSPQAPRKICIYTRNCGMTKAELETKPVDVRVREVCLEVLKERGVLGLEQYQGGFALQNLLDLPRAQMQWSFSRTRLAFVAKLRQ